MEVLIAMTLFMLGMVGFFALAAQMRGMSNLSTSMADATLLAGTTIEGFRNRSNPAALTAGGSTSGAYRVQWTVASTTGCLARSVSLQVNWTDFRGTPHTVRMNSILEK